MNLCKINKTLAVAGQNGFIFNQLHKLTIQIYSHQLFINLRHYLKFRISILRRQFFRIMSQNPDYMKTQCNDLDNPFHLQFVKA